MIRSALTLCGFLLGALSGIAAVAGHENYVYLLMALAVPWDKLGKFTGDSVEQLVVWRKQRQMEKELLVSKPVEVPTERFVPPPHEGPGNGRGSYQRPLRGREPMLLAKRTPRRPAN